jgi:hypothetical protein
MVTSDEKAYDGCNISRPMTLAELCRHDLRGIARIEQHMTYSYADYYPQMLRWGWVSIAISVATMISNLATGLLLLLVLSMSIVVVTSLAIMRRNSLIWQHLEYLRGDMRCVMMTSTRMLARYVADPSPAMFYVFDHSHSIPQQPLVAINRSDGMGNIIVFLKFDDDHDRVMFRLGQ